MSGVTILFIVLIVARTAFDIWALSHGGTSYRLEFLYFVLFLIAGGTMLMQDTNRLWGFAGLALSAVSLVLFFVKRSKATRKSGLAT